MCVYEVHMYEVHMATPDINQMFKKLVQDLFIISRFSSLTAGLPRPQRSKHVLVLLVVVYIDV